VITVLALPVGRRVEQPHSRAVAPADRVRVRRFLERFDRWKLEVTLQATTGWAPWWRSCARRATVHLAEPAETAARRRTKKRAKNERADARICAR
jgi:predicted thioesterase